MGGQFQQPSESPTSMSRRAKELDMDHQRVDFIDFVWAYYFIVPNAVWLWVSGILCLKVRELLRRVVCRRLGVRDPSVSVDPRRLVGQLMLEGTQLVYFNGKFRKDGKEVATFMWPDFPMVDANGKFKTAKMFRVDIDLESKCLEKAELDDEPLAARDALILVWFHTIFANLPDALYLDTDRCDPRFRKMAELGRVVRVGFVDDLPCLMFNKNYHNSPDKFYQRVYQGAAKLNKRLADHMDCCIIK